MKHKVLLVTPPLLQPNSPYPATAYLLSYLKSLQYDVTQHDLNIDFFLRLFSKRGLDEVLTNLNKKSSSNSVITFINRFKDYASTVEPAIRFLQGKDPSLAIRICRRDFLPEGPRFIPLQQHPEILDSFSDMGVQDLAKYLTSLYLDDLADVIKDGIDSDFAFSRYAESLASSKSSFEPLNKKISHDNNVLTKIFNELTSQLILSVPKHQKLLVGITVPFAGNMYPALKIATIIKSLRPETTIVFGGGYINTELRSLEDVSVFKFVDYLVFDAGLEPIARLLRYLDGTGDSAQLLRTWYLQDGKIVRTSEHIKKSASDAENKVEIKFDQWPTPSFFGFDNDKYLGMLELPNPMYRLWTDHRWNKILIAHGCYWKKCTFCDTHLDYISKYEPQKAVRLVDDIEKIIAETGVTGFHFVDEAAPPALLKQLALEIIRRDLKITWWGNLRFDAYFTDEIAKLLAESGCVAVTGGIEVASDRILKLINKGISIEQVAKVTKAFSDAGIFVHAYLMYGFPTQTVQETIDSLEIVRQLFVQGCLHSAHWHRFLATEHSPVGRSPKSFQVELLPMQKPKAGLFAKYEIPYEEISDKALSQKTLNDLGEGLRKALYNYMHGVGFKNEIHSWFKNKVPPTQVPRNWSSKILNSK